MGSAKDLTKGNIFKTILFLSLPIMAQSFIQMAYNMTDMIWLGRVGSNAVAAVGTAGFLVWLSCAFFLIPKIGAEVGVAQKIGNKDEVGARDFARNALQLSVISGLIFSVIMVLFAESIISFFKLGDQQVINDAIEYLRIISFFLVVGFINPVLSGVFNGLGNSKIPFYINSVGLVINIILDPLLIFKFNLGIKGAAYATIFSQIIVTVIFILLFHSKYKPFSEFHMFKKPHLPVMKKIFQIGTPVGLQSGLFTIFASILARIIAHWGATPIAVQKVGSQIEAISWMTASGFSSALSAFVGQNFGAKDWYRIKKGYQATMLLSGSIGLFATCLLLFFAESVFAIFIPNDPEALRIGIDYLHILGFSQIFMCMEITSQGAFNGLGKTMYPSISSIIFTGARIPLALWLSATILGLNGIWWAISYSSIAKGIILTASFILFVKLKPECSNIKSKKWRLIFKFDKRAWNDKRGLSGK